MTTAAERMDAEVNAYAASLLDAERAERTASCRQSKMELRASLANRDLTDLESELQSVRGLIATSKWDGLGMKQYWIVLAAHLRVAISRKLAP